MLAIGIVFIAVFLAMAFAHAGSLFLDYAEKRDFILAVSFTALTLVSTYFGILLLVHNKVIQVS